MHVKPHCLTESKQASRLLELPFNAIDNCLQCLTAVLEVIHEHLGLNLYLLQVLVCIQSQPQVLTLLSPPLMHQTPLGNTPSVLLCRAAGGVEGIVNG